MKEFVQRKPPLLYLVAVPQKRGDVLDFTQHTLEQSFAGWLRALEAAEPRPGNAPTLATSDPVKARLQGLQGKQSLELCRSLVETGVKEMEPQREVTMPTDPAPRALTTQDYVNVMLATTRESYQHARWPQEVIAKFLAGEPDKKLRDE